MPRSSVTRTAEGKILSRLRGKGRGKVYTNKDFLDLATRAATDRVLSHLCREGILQRVDRGIYYYPETNQRLGITLSPNPNDVAAAVARKTGSRLQPSGSVAANLLGLTTQVPATLVYQTDGPPKTIHSGNQTIVLKHVPPRELTDRATMSRLIILAFRHLGREAVDDSVVRKLRSTLSEADKRELLKDVSHQTDWIVAAAKKIAANK